MSHHIQEIVSEAAQPQAPTYIYGGQCLVVQDFWKTIFSMASKALETNIPPDPATALLNLKPAELNHNQFRLLIQLTTYHSKSMEIADLGCG